MINFAIYFSVTIAENQTHNQMTIALSIFTRVKEKNNYKGTFSVTKISNKVKLKIPKFVNASITPVKN